MSELSYFSIPSSAVGHTLNVLCCEPSGQQPRAVLQMTHGMAEHISRYEPLARWLADRGIAVIGHDHLGHGGTARSPEEYGFFALPDGNRTLLEDLYRVTKLAQDSWPGAPLFLLGHSMGSFYARQYLCEVQEAQVGSVGTENPADGTQNSTEDNDRTRTEFIDAPSFQRNQPGFKEQEDGKRQLNGRTGPVIFVFNRRNEQRPAILAVCDRCHTDDTKN